MSSRVRVVTPRYVVLLLLICIDVRGPHARADSGDDGDLWEIQVTASLQETRHQDAEHQGLHRKFDETITASTSWLVKCRTTSDLDHLALCTDSSDVVSSTGGGSRSARRHEHTNQVVPPPEPHDTSDSFGGDATISGVTFSWNDGDQSGLLEVGTDYAGTDDSVDDGRKASSQSTAHALFTAETGKPGVTIKKMKYGFAVDWSHSETKTQPDGLTSTVEQHGHATIRRFVQHDPIELIVTPADYQNWMPQAGPSDRVVGNVLAVEAVLRNSQDPNKPILDEQKAHKIRFELSRVSRVPGVAMNAPITPSGDDVPADLQFVFGGGLVLKPSNEPMTAETPDGATGLTQASAAIGAFDWGAWGSLKVTAELDDGEVIVGHLAGKQDTEILVPRRTSRPSHVAASWLEAHHVSGKSDDDDSEVLQEPAGTGMKKGARTPNAHAGDGYTLYEEYRGFIENGEHITGDPNKQDLMIYDEIGGRSKDGLELLATISGLVVHSDFTSDEFDTDDRLMNRNYSGESSHVTDQHGLDLVLDDNTVSKAEGVLAGTPGQHTKIKITELISSSETEWQSARVGKRKVISSLFVSTIAHEVLHGCGVRHHGEVDLGNVAWWKGTDASGAPVILEGTYTTKTAANGKTTTIPGAGHAVHVMRENGSPVSPDTYATPYVLWVGRKAGQHSGFSNCVMRYDNAEAYVSDRDPAGRYKIDEETGISLCDGKQDVDGGVNAQQHAPQPRYGDADMGDCFHQIHIKDGSP